MIKQSLVQLFVTAFAADAVFVDNLKRQYGSEWYQHSTDESGWDDDTTIASAKAIIAFADLRKANGTTA